MCNPTTGRGVSLSAEKQMPKTGCQPLANVLPPLLLQPTSPISRTVTAERGRGIARGDGLPESELDPVTPRPSEPLTSTPLAPH